MRLVKAGGAPRVAIAAVSDRPPIIAAEIVKADQASSP